MKDKKVRFIRVKGRIIPIRGKRAETKKGYAKISAGILAGGAGAASASKNLKSSFGSFRKSSEFLGLSRLVAKGSKTQSSFIKKAAVSKLRGIKLTNKARTKFGLAIGISSLLLGSGVNDLFKKDSNIRDEVSGIAGTVGAGLIVGAVGKKFGIKATGINELFSGFARQGRKLSKMKISRVSRTRFDSKRMRKGTQFEFKF